MYIQFTKDLNKIKNSVFLGMGVREIIIAVIAIGLALYITLSPVEIKGCL